MAAVKKGAMDTSTSTMDDATRLIGNLEEKLAALDHKVATYRQGLADEFTRHSRQLLRDLPESLSATVQGSVALSLHKYPAISPALPAAATPRPAAAAAAAAAEQATLAPHPRPQGPHPPGAADSPSSNSKPPFGTCMCNTAPPPPGAATLGTGATRTGTGTATATATNTRTSTSTTAAFRPADHEASSPAPRLPRPATPPSALLPPRRAPPPRSHRRTDDLGHMSDSPDDREAELRGVFTPSFLPLLDTSINNLMRAPPTPPKPRSPPRNTLTPTTMDRSRPGPTGTGESQPSPSPPSSSPLPPPTTQVQPPQADTQADTQAHAHAPVRPPSIRHTTDDLSTSSLLSDKSDSKSRRSALRRSSSSSKPQSPRRVRFDVAGTEVLPTTSPSNSSPNVRQSLSDDKNYTTPVSEPEHDSNRTRSVAAILGLAETDDDDEPPPKKVSSSQALRALSRLPLDNDTEWIPVTQESTPDPDSERQGARADAVQCTSSLNSETPTAAARSAAGPQQTPPPAPTAPLRRPAPLEVARAKSYPDPPALQSTWSRQDDDDDSDDSSDGDFLSIAKPKSFANKKALMSPRSISPDEESRRVPARRATTDAVPRPADVAKPRALTPGGPLEEDAPQENSGVPGSAGQTPDEAPDVGPDFSDVFDFEASDDMPPPSPPSPPPGEVEYICSGSLG